MDLLRILHWMHAKLGRVASFLEPPGEKITAGKNYTR